MTDLSRHMQQQDFEDLQSRRPAGAMGLKSVAAGAATTVYAATAPELDGMGGIYLEDCGIAPIDDDSQVSGVRSYAVDPDRARQLWTLSEGLTGQTLDL